MIGFLKKLFVCCYRFQTCVGNGDMPVFMSMCMILFAIYMYLTGISMGVLFYWVNIIGNHAVFGLKTLMLCNVILCCILGGMFYIKCLKGNRLNQILAVGISTSDRVSTVVFIIGSIISLCGVFIFMWAVNNGFILEEVRL